MARRSDNKQATSDGSDQALQEALRRRSEQRITDLRDPIRWATGTERISHMLAEARRERDEAAEGPHDPETERPGDARLLSWEPPLPSSTPGQDQPQSSPADAG